MAEHRRHPLYRAIQQSMVSITQIVKFNEVEDSLFAAELLTREDIEEYERLTNSEAVRKMTRKLMRSTTLCEKFLKILQEMPQEYQELAKIITDKHKQNIESSSITQYTNQVAATLQETESPDGEPVENANSFQVITHREVEDLLEEGKEMADALLKQKSEMKSIMDLIPVQKIAYKSFTEFLLHIIKLFRTAIQKNTISLKTAVRQSVTHQLNHCFVILRGIHKNFCGADNTEDTTHIKELISIVLLEYSDVLDIIKGIQRTYWLKFSQSAKTISSLLPILEKITKVVRAVSKINEENADSCRLIGELLGSVEDLKASLVKIKKILSVTIDSVGLSTTLFFAFAGVTCCIMGVILIATPAGIPLMITGGAVTVISPALSYGIAKLCSRTINNFGDSVDDTKKESEEFVRDQPDILKSQELLQSQG